MIERRILDEEIHPESEFENQFAEVTVTADEFPARKAKLYAKAADIDISSAEDQIVYKLYNDNNELMQTENVPVVKDGHNGIDGKDGTDGTDGAQGGSYKGAVSRPEDAVENDFYLDVDAQTIFYFHNKAWNEDVLDEDNLSWRWNAAIQDCIANASNTGNLLKAANIWTEKIVANTVLANKIKAASGFFDSIEVNNATINEDCVILGRIAKRIDITIKENGFDIRDALPKGNDGNLVIGEYLMYCNGKTSECFKFLSPVEIGSYTYDRTQIIDSLPVCSLRISVKKRTIDYFNIDAGYFQETEIFPFGEVLSIDSDYRYDPDYCELSCNIASLGSTILHCCLMKI